MKEHTVEVVEGLHGDISRIIAKTNCKIWFGSNGITVILTDLGGLMINVNKKHAAYEKLYEILHNSNEVHRKSARLLAKEKKEGQTHDNNTL